MTWLTEEDLQNELAAEQEQEEKLKQTLSPEEYQQVLQERERRNDLRQYEYL